MVRMECLIWHPLPFGAADCKKQNKTKIIIKKIFS